MQCRHYCIFKLSITSFVHNRSFVEFICLLNTLEFRVSKFFYPYKKWRKELNFVKSHQNELKIEYIWTRSSQIFLYVFQRQSVHSCYDYSHNKDPGDKFLGTRWIPLETKQNRSGGGAGPVDWKLNDQTQLKTLNLDGRASLVHDKSVNYIDFLTQFLKINYIRRDRNSRERNC